MGNLNSMILRPAHFLGRPALCLGLAAALAFGQSDPLISKNISHVFADGAGFWAFSSDGVKFSRIDPFTEPLDIRNGILSTKYPIRGGVGRDSSILVFYNGTRTDTTVAGIAALDRNGKSPADSLVFTRSTGQTAQVTLDIEFSALAEWRDTVIIGAGRAGFALSRAKAEGKGVLAGDSLIFFALPEEVDTAVAAVRCAPNRACPVAPILKINDSIGEPDSVSALAVDASAPDSVWLLIGTRTGLRRGLLGGTYFPPVALPASKPGSPMRIESIHADPDGSLLWVFSGAEYFFSDDHGRTFRKPPKIESVATDPASLTGFTSPRAVNIGDTAFVNFNLDNPGLVAFRKDTILANQGTGDFADVILDAGDGLDIDKAQGKLTGMAVVAGDGGSVLAVGSQFRGLFLRRQRAGGTASWTNVNSLKTLKNDLQEVITFPTLFSGTGPDGGPEYVNIGYRLKKSGNVTITVYNYAMEKVKTVVRNSHREGGGSRSEKAGTDRWDGRDESGRHVSVGIYYILVESGSQKAWGKAIAVRGRGP